MNDLQRYREYLFGIEISAIPTHTQETIVSYLIYGYPPGGFMNAILTNDLWLSVQRADFANERSIPDIVKWILNNIPETIYGTNEKIHNWCDDKNGKRTEYVNEISKKITWNVLND